MVPQSTADTRLKVPCILQEGTATLPQLSRTLPTVPGPGHGPGQLCIPAHEQDTASVTETRARSGNQHQGPSLAGSI